jgi:SAM-dependent methyltransferase
VNVRDSGMPEETTWQGFFDPPAVLAKLGFADAAGDVVELGCGYGTFSVAAAAASKGTVHAFDVDPAMIAATTAKARAHGLTNLQPTLRDFVAEGTSLADASAGYAMLFNILHAEQPLSLVLGGHTLDSDNFRKGISSSNASPASSAPTISRTISSVSLTSPSLSPESLRSPSASARHFALSSTVLCGGQLAKTRPSANARSPGTRRIANP